MHPLMPKLRFLLRIVKRAALGLLAFVLIYALLALLLPRITVHSDYRPPDRGVQLFVVSNGVHTDFLVPVRTPTVDWTQHLPTEWFERVERSCPYVVFGWGDKGFYLETPTWNELKLATAFKAAFFLGSSAMHVSYLDYQPAVSDACRRLTVSPEQYAKLVEYLLASFQHDAASRLRLIDHAGYTTHDRFFEATGTYSLIHTCNAWTGSGLDAIGVKTGVWTPFAWDVLRYLDR